jgi:glycosyltransferase involved in cell wall biosynthesis
MTAEGITLTLGGFGPQRELLERQAAVYSNVTFLGWVEPEELMSTMAGFDVFVQIEDPAHPAYRWVSPNKVFESMALSRPIVVAAGTLAAERATEAGHGILVRYGDGANLRDALRQLRDDPDWRDELGSAGREVFLRAYTLDTIQTRIHDAYPAPRGGG